MKKFFKKNKLKIVFNMMKIMIVICVKKDFFYQKIYAKKNAQVQ